MRCLFLFTLLCFVSACGDGIPDIGDGNGALLVIANADFDGNRTRVRVEVFRNNNRLGENEANVQVAVGENGALQTLNQGGGQRFEIDLNGYTRDLRLLVTAGADNVDAFFQGPSPIIISSPAAGQVFEVSQGEDVFVAWEGIDGDSATEVEISTQGFRTTILGDPGEFSIPFFDVNRDANEVTIRRTNVAELDGGVPGSFFRISAEADVSLSIR